MSGENVLLRHDFLSKTIVIISCILLIVSAVDFLFDNGLLKLLRVSFFFFSTCLFMKMMNMKVSPGRSFYSTLRHFMSLIMLDFFGNMMTKKMLKQSKQVREAQEKFLMTIIRQNENTVFGVDYNFASISNRNAFVRSVSLARLPERNAYIDRTFNGEENVLFKEPVTCFGVTSGTSGKCNLMPSNRSLTSNFLKYGVGPFYHSMVKTFPQCKQLQRSLKIMFSPKWRFTDTGIRVGPTSSNPDDTKRILHMYTTPFIAYEILEEKELTYIHLLFALKDPLLGMMETNFISAVYNLLIAMHENWEDLITDIENGTLNKKIVICDSVREKLEALLRPDPRRAKALRVAYSYPQKGLLRRIWPEMHAILSTDTGAFEVYRRLVLENEAFGLKTYSPVYAATEGLIGVNLWPLDERRHYLLLPGAMFYEFIPIEQSFNDNPQTLFMDQVELDGIYELVVTTVGGLYRHRIGDVIRVSDFEGQCPIVEFMYRMGTILNVRGEKMSEDYFYRCLSKVVDESGFAIVDYCCVESPLYENALGLPRSSPPKYHVFLEVKPQLHSQQLQFPTLTNELDQSMAENNYVYSSFRVKGSIGMPEIHQVEEQGFLALREFLLASTDASSNQLKIPRVLQRDKAVKFLKSLVVRL